MNKYKNEEGAVLLLLIIMMSAVVLIVASLLRFNTQNIRFAAIEIEQEQALYLAEGVADAVDYYLLDQLSDDVAIIPADVSPLMDNYVDSGHADFHAGLASLVFPGTETLVGETILDDLEFHFDSLDVDGNVNGSFSPDNNVLRLRITVVGAAASRTIVTTYRFPETKPEFGYESFIVSKELNYSN